MAHRAFASKRPFMSWLKNIFNRNQSQAPRKRDVRSRMLSLEMLEDRIVPATLTDGGIGGNFITITLASSEAITISSTAANQYNLAGATFNPSFGDPGNTFVAGVLTPAATVTTINIFDTGTGNSITFGANTQPYNDFFNILLDDTSGGILFTAAQPVGFFAGVTAAVDGSITDGAGATFIQVIGDASFTSGANVTLNGPLLFSGGDTNLASGTGGISAVNAGNTFSGIVSLSTTGTAPTDNIALLESDGFLDIGDVVFGTAAGLGQGGLTLTVNGSIGDNSVPFPNGIQTRGSVTLNITAAGTVALDGADHNIAGPVTIVSNAANLGSVFFRNVNSGAAIPVNSGWNYTGGDIATLSLDFPNNAVNLPAIDITGDLFITAGGNITQSAAFNVPAGSAGFTVEGNFGITLTNAANAVAGTVSFDNDEADATTGLATPGSTDVRYVETGSIVINASRLGHGFFDVTAVTGNITDIGSITQQPGAAGARFEVTAGTDIILNNAGNIFTGPVTYVGGALVNSTFRNDDTLANLFFPTIPSAAANSSVTINFGNAPVVLPNLSLPGAASFLSITGQGIRQAANTAITSGNDAFFNANAFPLILDSTTNNFTNIEVNNTGTNEVVIVESNGLNFGSATTLGISDIGFGPLNVRVISGNITETAGDSIQFAFTGTLSTIGNSGFGYGKAHLQTDSPTGTITLTELNRFRGPLEIVCQSDVSIINDRDTLLANTTIGGNLTISGNFEDVTQLPGASFNVTGNLTVAGNTINIVLDNLGNRVGGNVALTATGSASYREDDATNGLDLGAVAITNNLTVISGNTAIDDTALVTVGGTALFNSGTGTILLDFATSDYDTVSLITTAATAAVTDMDDVTIGRMELGATALTLTGTDIFDAGIGGITQTGAATVSLQAGANGDVNASGNIRGSISINADPGSVVIDNASDITFLGTPNNFATLDLSAEGVVNLPTVATLNVTSLSTSGTRTVVNSDISATSVVFNGDTQIGAARTITSTGVIEFHGDVGGATTGPTSLAPVGGALTLVAGNYVWLAPTIDGSVWNQGTNTLNVTASGFGLIFGGYTAGTARFMMGTGVINMVANDTLIIDDVFQAGINPDQTTGETVTINTTGSVVFSDGGFGFGFGVLSVGLGATNDKLVVNGAASSTSINTTSELHSTSGATSLAGSNVLEVTGAGATLTGTFDNTVDTNGDPVPFFSGTDIVQATNGVTAVSLAQAGTLDPTGTFTVFEADSDRIVVTTAASAGLAHFVDPNTDELFIVLRSAPAASTLSIVTTKVGGDGFGDIAGIAVNGPTAGATTISAATADVNGDIFVGNRLTALTVHDVNSGTITGRGTNAALTTTITGRVFSGVDIDLFTVLSSLSLKAFSGTIEAERFGTIKTTSVPAAGITGNFSGDIVNRNSLNSPAAALTLASIAGDLDGTWDLGGNVGTIIAAHEVDSFILGRDAGANVPNGGRLNNITSLAFGVVSNTDINVIGRIGSIKAKSWDTGVIEAASIGTFTTTGDATIGDVGDIDTVDITLTGNSAGVALGVLNIKGNWFSGNLTVENGNITTILVGREMNSVNIDVASTTTSGKITTLQAGAWTIGSLDAKSVATFRIVGNAVAHLFGDLDTVTVTLHGTPNSATATLGIFSASHDVSSSPFTIENGNLTSFTVNHSVSSSPITVLGKGGATTLGGAIGTITAGDWSSSNIIAKSIGVMNVKGVSTAAAISFSVATTALVGDMEFSRIFAFLNTGVGKGIGSLSVAGDLNNTTFIRADNGIGSLTVKRQLSGNGFIFATNSSTANVSVGRIGVLKAGRITNTTIVANTIGVASTTGFTIVENGTTNFTPGDVASSTILVNGRNLVAPLVGIGTFTVAGDFNNSTLRVINGMTAMTVKRSINNSTIIADNPTALSFGRIGSLTAGRITNSTLRADSIGVLKTVKGSVFQEAQLSLNGDINSSRITVVSSLGGVAIGTLAVGGAFTNNGVNIPAKVTTFTVFEEVFNSARDTAGNGAMGIGYASGGIGTLSAAAWQFSDLTTRNITTFNVKGNAARVIVGNVTTSLFTIKAANAGIALGTFTSTGVITNSVFNVAAGNVTSFSAARMLDGSGLFVGVHLAHANDIANTAASVWLGTFKVGTFKLTTIFSASNLDNTAAMRDANLVAGSLGTVTISGVDPLASQFFPQTYGVGFRNTGGLPGVVIVNALARAQGFTDGKFIRTIGLAG